VVPSQLLNDAILMFFLSKIDKCYEEKQDTKELEKIRKERNKALYHSWMMQMLEPIVDQRYSEGEVPYIAAKTFMDRIGRCLDEH